MFPYWDISWRFIVRFSSTQQSFLAPSQISGSLPLRHRQGQFSAGGWRGGREFYLRTPGARGGSFPDGRFLSTPGRAS